MKCLSHKKPKRALQDRILRNDLSGEFSTTEPFINTDCPFYKLLTSSSLRRIYFDKINRPPACVMKSEDLHVELNNRRGNGRDRLCPELQITCCALDDIDLSYSIDDPDPLEDSGMHLTTNPGFGYSKSK